MTSKKFGLSNFNTSVAVASNKSGLVLSIWHEHHKDESESMVFCTRKESTLQFWNHDTRGFVTNRPRPNPIIGNWNVGRIIAVSFLERLMNVPASQVGTNHLVSVFTDDALESMLDFAKIDRQSQL